MTIVSIEALPELLRAGQLGYVREWLYEHLDELFDSSDTDLRERADAAWGILWEYESGEMDEPAARQALRELCSPVKALAEESQS